MSIAIVLIVLGMLVIAWRGPLRPAPAPGQSGDAR